MPDTRTICYYAMYVIGEVESNWNWTAVNYNDPITIGMMQWYGTRAAQLLNRIKDEMPDAYGRLAASLRSDIESHAATDGWWTTRYLNQAEGNSIIDVFSEEQNHVIQENQAISDFEGYISTLESWGMSQENPKPLIFAMSMYHQVPAECGVVLGSASGSATLDRIYEVCMNDPVFMNYANRYNTVYQRLKDWDGESMPPDFGQSGEASSGGNNAQIGTAPNKFNYIIQSGDTLVLYGKDEYKNGVVFYPAGGQRWTTGHNANGTPIEGGTTDGGDASGSEGQQAVVDLYRSWENRFYYTLSPTERLTPLTSGGTDCSGSIWCAYNNACGIDVGTWTGEMAGKGTKIASGYSSDLLPIADMQPADLVLVMHWGWNPSFDHVELYMGNNELWGHGGGADGSEDGPNLTTSDAEHYGQYEYYWEVRRYL